MLDKKKLKYILDLWNIKTVFTESGNKLKWTGVVGEELISHTANDFLSKKSIQKWKDFVNNYDMPEPKPVIVQEDVSLQSLVDDKKPAKKRGKNAI